MRCEPKSCYEDVTLARSTSPYLFYAWWTEELLWGCHAGSVHLSLPVLCLVNRRVAMRMSPWLGLPLPTCSMRGEPKSCYEDVTLVRSTSPYLFPCTIIYSIIAAGIVYRLYQYVGVKVKQRWPSHTSLTSSVPQGMFLQVFFRFYSCTKHNFHTSYFLFSEKL